MKYAVTASHFSRNGCKFASANAVEGGSGLVQSSLEVLGFEGVQGVVTEVGECGGGCFGGVGVDGELDEVLFGVDVAVCFVVDDVAVGLGRVDDAFEGDAVELDGQGLFAGFDFWDQGVGGLDEGGDFVEHGLWECREDSGEVFGCLQFHFEGTVGDGADVGGSGVVFVFGVDGAPVAFEWLEAVEVAELELEWAVEVVVQAGDGEGVGQEGDLAVGCGDLEACARLGFWFVFGNQVARGVDEALHAGFG